MFNSFFADQAASIYLRTYVHTYIHACCLSHYQFICAYTAVPNGSYQAVLVDLAEIDRRGIQQTALSCHGYSVLNEFNIRTHAPQPLLATVSAPPLRP